MEFSKGGGVGDLVGWLFGGVVDFLEGGCLRFLGD